MVVLKMVDPHNHGFHYYDGLYIYIMIWMICGVSPFQETPIESAHIKP